MRMDCAGWIREARSALIRLFGSSLPDPRQRRAGGSARRPEWLGLPVFQREFRRVRRVRRRLGGIVGGKGIARMTDFKLALFNKRNSLLRIFGRSRKTWSLGHKGAPGSRR